MGTPRQSSLSQIYDSRRLNRHKPNQKEITVYLSQKVTKQITPEGPGSGRYDRDFSAESKSSDMRKYLADSESASYGESPTNSALPIQNWPDIRACPLI
jgi:hypothetical protein